MLLALRVMCNACRMCRDADGSSSLCLMYTTFDLHLPKSKWDAASDA